MSTTTTTTIRASVPTRRERLMQEMLRACSGLDSLPAHTRLSSIAGSNGLQRNSSGVASNALARLESRHATVVQEPAVAVAARTADPAAWSIAERLLGESRAAVASSPARAESLAEQGDLALRSALEGGARALAVEERTATTSILEDALRSLGCRTTTALGSAATGIWAERGHELVAVLIRDGGEVEIDRAGFQGSDCSAFQDELDRAIVARGGRFEGVDVVEHGDAAGGALIRNAARAAGPRGDMARAIATQAEPPVKKRFSRERQSGSGGTAQRATNRSAQ